MRIRNLILLALLATAPATAWAKADCNADKLTATAATDEDPASYYRRGMEALHGDNFAGADEEFRSAYGAAGRAGTPEATQQMEAVSLARLVETSLQQAGGKSGPALTTAYFRLRALRRITEGKTVQPWIHQIMLAADQATVAVPEEPGTIATLHACKAFGVRATVDVRILFDYDSSAVSSEGLDQLRNVGGSLASLDVARVIVRGHTDKHGADAYNLALSKRRAEAVIDDLVKLEPNLAGKLVADGTGWHQMLYPDDGEQYDRMNRRVEFILVDKGN